jgi:hypothetical protein
MRFLAVFVVLLTCMALQLDKISAAPPEQDVAHHHTPLPLPADPAQQCNEVVFYNFTKQNRACSVNFYHRKDPGT